MSDKDEIIEGTLRSLLESREELKERLEKIAAKFYAEGKSKPNADEAKDHQAS